MSDDHLRAAIRREVEVAEMMLRVCDAMEAKGRRIAELQAEVERLRERLAECELFVRVLGLDSEPAAKAAEAARAVLARGEG